MALFSGRLAAILVKHVNGSVPQVSSLSMVFSEKPHIIHSNVISISTNNCFYISRFSLFCSSSESVWRIPKSTPVQLTFSDLCFNSSFNPWKAFEQLRQYQRFSLEEWAKSSQSHFDLRVSWIRSSVRGLILWPPCKPVILRTMSVAIIRSNLEPPLMKFDH